MSVAEMRPTFLLETELSVEESMRRIKSAFSTSAGGYHGQFTDRHVMLSIEESKRQFWSPWLQLEVREGEQRSQIFGRFSPHPSIWTGFMFSYLALAVIIFFAAMFGMAQQMASQSPWAYYLIPTGILIATVLWFASKAGQKLARDEMRQMKSIVAECLE